jgi:hypothetical protein
MLLPFPLVQGERPTIGNEVDGGAKDVLLAEALDEGGVLQVFVLPSAARLQLLQLFQLLPQLGAPHLF